MPVSNPSLRAVAGLVLGLGAVTTVSAAQVCNANAQRARPDGQYQISADGTEVTDLASGLIWKRCVEGMSWDGEAGSCVGTPTLMNWSSALSYSAAQAGGWRVPNLNELLTLVDSGCERPAINLTAFPGTPMYPTASFVVTISTHADSDGDIWRVDFNEGSDDLSRKTTGQQVRLVRSPVP